MTRHPFGTDPDCRCPDVAALLDAAFAGTGVVPCPVHQLDELTRRRTAAKVAEAEAERDLLADALGATTAGDELAERRRAKADREASIDDGADPLLRSLTRAVRRDTTIRFPTDDGPDAA